MNYTFQFGVALRELQRLDDRTLLDIRPRRVVVLDEGKAVDVPNGLSLEEGDELEGDEPAQSEL